MKHARIDKLGRVVIPIGYRKELNLTENSDVKISLYNGQIIIEPGGDLCRLCKTNTIDNCNIALCKACIKIIKALDNY